MTNKSFSCRIFGLVPKKLLMKNEVDKIYKIDTCYCICHLFLCQLNRKQTCVDGNQFFLEASEIMVTLWPLEQLLKNDQILQKQKCKQSTQRNHSGTLCDVKLSLMFEFFMLSKENLNGLDIHGWILVPLN